MTREQSIPIKEIMDKLLKFNPGIKDDKYTNPFIYQDVEKWYKQLEKLCQENN